MSPVYHVAPGQETDGEPSTGYYFEKNEKPCGPFFTHREALAAFHDWNDQRNAVAA